jgi:hypothetical protein
VNIISIGIVGYYETDKKLHKNIGTHGTFASVSCHILVEGDFLLKFTKNGDEID